MAGIQNGLAPLGLPGVGKSKYWRAFISVVFTQTIPQRENLSSASGRCMTWLRSRKHLISWAGGTKIEFGEERRDLAMMEAILHLSSNAGTDSPATSALCCKVQKRSDRSRWGRGRKTKQTKSQNILAWEGGIAPCKEERRLVSPKRRDFREFGLGSKDKKKWR